MQRVLNNRNVINQHFLILKSMAYYYLHKEEKFFLIFFFIFIFQITDKIVVQIFSLHCKRALACLNSMKIIMPPFLQVVCLIRVKYEITRYRKKS